jgi:stearoyl-CoA desaturase (delta-9 desaturase)
MTAAVRQRPAAAPLLDGRKTGTEQALVVAFMVLPLLALAAAVPLAWGWGLSWLDVGLAVAFYMLSGLGVTVGFHRYFTHGSFKAKRPLRVVR